MNFLTQKTFKEKISQMNVEYWNKTFDARWQYMKIAINELKRVKAEKIIELGTNGVTLCENSDIIELCDFDYSGGKKYLLDATQTPWSEISDKQYDCFVALQVIEHLTPHQIEVFNEIKRISKRCIISLPYMWENTDANHKGIDLKKIKSWTKLTPYHYEIIGKAPRKRIVLFYRGY